MLYEHTKEHGFHRGRQWFGAGIKVSNGVGPDDIQELQPEANVPDPVAVAFNVEYDGSKTGWFSARVNENLLAAIQHVINVMEMNEEGMELYMRGLENVSPVELHALIESQYNRTLTA